MDPFASTAVATKLRDDGVCILENLVSRSQAATYRDAMADLIGQDAGRGASVEAERDRADARIDLSRHPVFADLILDELVLAAVEAYYRRPISVCLAYAVVEALANGFEVCFVEDAVGDTYKDNHDIAVRRLIQAGAVPNSTQAMFIEWYRDWKSPFASSARELLPPYVSALTALKQAPQFREAPGVVPPQHV